MSAAVEYTDQISSAEEEAHQLVSENDTKLNVMARLRF